MKREQIFSRDGWKCVNCGSGEELTIDHKIPRSRGGSNRSSNKQTLCSPCNAGKGNKMPGVPYEPLRPRAAVPRPSKPPPPRPIILTVAELSPILRAEILGRLPCRSVG